MPGVLRISAWLFKVSPTGLSPVSGRAFQTRSASPYSRIVRNPTTVVTGLWAAPLSLATTTESFLFLGYLDVSVPRGSPRHPIYSDGGMRACPHAGFPIRISSGSYGCTHLIRSFSQCTTSFFGRQCQGIPHRPLVRFFPIHPSGCGDSEAALQLNRHRTSVHNLCFELAGVTFCLCCFFSLIRCLIK